MLYLAADFCRIVQSPEFLEIFDRLV